MTHRCLQPVRIQRGIAAEAVREALVEIEAPLAPLVGARRPVRRFLPSDGIPVAGSRDSAARLVVAAWAARSPNSLSRSRCFTAEVEEALDFLAGLMPRPALRSYEDAIASFASMAGA